MNKLILDDIYIEHNEILDNSEQEESEEEESKQELEESDSSYEGDLNEESEYEENEEEEEDSDSDSDDDKNLFEPIIFQLTDDFRFVSPIIQSNPSTSLYKAIDKNTNTIVCVKMVISKSNQIPIEVKILEYIRRLGGHENIQELIGVYHQTSTAWVIITKFYESTSSYQSKCLFSNGATIHMFMKQLFQGLVFLHSNSIIHRDIKPSNLLWNNETKHLTIIDFDLSCWNHSAGHSQSVGTDGYTAPEVLNFSRDVTSRPKYFQEIDLYSSGCVFAGLMHSVHEDDMKEKYFYVWRSKYSKMKSREYDDDLLLGLIEYDRNKRISASAALQSNYIIKSNE